VISAATQDISPKAPILLVGHDDCRGPKFKLASFAKNIPPSAISKLTIADNDGYWKSPHGIRRFRYGVYYLQLPSRVCNDTLEFGLVSICHGSKDHDPVVLVHLPPRLSLYVHIAPTSPRMHARCRYQPRFLSRK
jgi:hypothetical protein